MKNKGAIIAVVTVALALLVSAGIAIAAGTSGGQKGPCLEGESAVGTASETLSFECRNAGEEDHICAENRAGEGNGSCEGDCEQERLRECDCDGECDGDGEGTQNRSGWSEQPGERGAAAGEQAGLGAQNGECAGDCERLQDRLCDGECDGECQGDGTQSQKRGSS